MNWLCVLLGHEWYAETHPSPLTPDYNEYVLLRCKYCDEVEFGPKLWVEDDRARVVD